MIEELGNNQIGSGGRPAKGSRERRTRESQAQIAELAIKKFLEDPSTFWSSFPELAHAIERHLQQSSRGRRREPVFEGYMTEREREFKLHRLSEMVGRYHSAQTVQPEEAREALALAAALRESAGHYKAALLEMTERILEVLLDLSERQKITFVKGKTAHHTFELIRGLTLFLAWDGELIAIELNPEEYRERQKGLSFVGIASDTMSDVASNHDAYLWDNPDGR